MTKRFFVLFFINLVLVLLQLSFFGEIFGGRLLPNLVLAFAFALVFSELGMAGKMSAFLGGVLLDLLGFNIVGLSTVVLISCMIMYDFVRKNISRNLVVNALSVFISTAIYDKILFSTGSFASAFITLLFCGTFYVFVANAAGYFLKSGYKLSDEK